MHKKNIKINSTNEQPFSTEEAFKKIYPLIEKTVEELGLILLEAEFVKEFGCWTLKIFIHADDRYISHEDCEKTAKALNQIFENIIPFQYFLEISSPGAERKLKSEKEYTIFKGKTVKIKYKELPVNENKAEVFIIIGKIIDYEKEKGLSLEIESTGEIKQILYKNIILAKLHLK